MKRVLFVCLGNICRSPLAEGLFKQKLIDRGLETQYRVDSAGTSDYHIGELPDERTRANALANGLTLNHRGRQFNMDDFRNFDQIIVMDKSNLEKVLNKSRSATEAGKVKLMRYFETEESFKNTDVPDPYYGGESGFQNVFEILDRTTENLLIQLEAT